MQRALTVILFLALTIQLFPQSVIRNRSAQGYVNIARDAASASASAYLISARSPQGYVNIISEVLIKPPKLLSDVPKFVDSDANNFIDANEHARIFFVVRNTGEGPALNLEARITETNRIPGLSFSSINLGSMQPGEVRTVEIPVEANENTTNSTASFSISLKEQNGFGTDIGTVIVQTRELPKPLVSVADIDYGNRAVRKNTTFNVKVLIRNSGPGKAENVKVTLPLPENVFLTSGSLISDLGTLPSGETKEVNYTLVTNMNYSLSKVILPFIVSESFGKFADNSKSTATIPVDLMVAENKQVVVQGEENRVQRVAEPITAQTSDVDINIPKNTSRNQNKVALIIGNEDYSKAFNPESNVDFASNDARIFAEYAEKILGINEKYVLLSVDATYMVMKSQVQRAVEIAKVMGSEAEIIFYYAGHGFPDQATKIPYLIPVDVSAANLTSAIKLADVYADLGSSGAGRVSVFLDACFSGGGRDMGPLNARSVRMAPSTEENMITGNMIVFTASTGEQTAQALASQKHGLFTYYLLKKLKETSGNVTYGDLFEYIEKNVQLDALTVNNKPQVPVYLSSETIGDKWKSWKIR